MPVTKEYYRQYYQRNKERIRAYKNARRKGKPEKNQTYGEKRLAHPERVKSREAVKGAVKAGVLPKISTLSCAGPGCSAVAQSYHHWSYEQCNWLSVIPLCSLCHGSLHAGYWSFDNPLAYTAHFLQLSLGF